jgi:hypothetical protein
MLQSQFFPFLNIGPHQRRTTYYNSLSKLLFMEENISKFEAFMDPFKLQMNFISDQLSRGILSAEMKVE